MRIIAGNGAILLSESDRVLLLKREHEPYAGWWSFPGGKLNHGEMLKEGVKREIREETALDIHKPLLRALLNERYYEASSLLAHFLLFYWEERNRISSSDMEKVASSAEGELSWFPIDSLPEYFVPSDRKVLVHISENRASHHPVVFEGMLEKTSNDELMLLEWERVT